MENCFAVLILVLAGVIGVLYMRRLDGNSNLKPGSGSTMSFVKPFAATKAGAANVKAQHVAAITAAILTATRGRGRILNIVPQSGSVSVFSDATRRWRAIGIVASVGRRLAPSWKR